MQLAKLTVSWVSFFLIVSALADPSRPRLTSSELTRDFLELKIENESDLDVGFEKIEDVILVVNKDLLELSGQRTLNPAKKLDELMKLVVAALPFDMESQIPQIMASSWGNPKLKQELKRWFDKNPSCEAERLLAFFQERECEQSKLKKDCSTGFSDVECAARKKSGATPASK